MELSDDIERVLFSASEIESAVDRIAEDVTRLHRGTDFTVVGVLKGSCLFVSDLIRRIPIPLELTFAGASSYGDRTRPRDLQVQFLPTDRELEGREVLLVDDILDTGRTLFRMRQEILRLGARRVRTCVLLDKPSRREIAIEADHVGFTIEDRFVVGYGLDFGGRYRNLPYVGVLDERVLAAPRAAGEKGS